MLLVKAISMVIISVNSLYERKRKSLEYIGIQAFGLLYFIGSLEMNLNLMETNCRLGKEKN